jgi:hypothetical protein
MAFGCHGRPAEQVRRSAIGRSTYVLTAEVVGEVGELVAAR